MSKSDYLNNADISSIMELYQQYQNNPDSIDIGWKFFFDGFEFAQTCNFNNDNITKEFKVLNLINAYRERGHYFTLTNPVRKRRSYTPTLDINNFGLEENDLNTVFNAGNEVGLGSVSLINIIDKLNKTYCQTIGVEYMYIRNTKITEWLKYKMEGNLNTPLFSKNQKIKIFEKISQAVIFEKFLYKKFPGQKTFSLSGAESLIPALQAIIEHAADKGAEEFVIGMAHRGRLNVLANILNKPFEKIFNEFASKEYDDKTLLGDVKYHLGYSSRILLNNKTIKLNLAPNPSHLEAVNPVVQGITKALINKYYNNNYKKVIPILIHGDASIAGQGVVYELTQMSELDAYKVGGSIHIVINNQIGFTTNYLQARSSTYCTDVAKIIQSPIFHVNGDDLEAVVYTVMLAIDYREKFNKDIFIDLLCYRRFGHNESDEPKFTQPLLYKTIENHPDSQKIYADLLINNNIISKDEVDFIEEKIKNTLEEKIKISQSITDNKMSIFLEEANKCKKNTLINEEEYESTFINIDILKDIGLKITALPENKVFFSKTVKLQKARREMIMTGQNINWSMAELLAFGSLLYEGINVRITGQDTERGTFSQRHAVITLEDSEEQYIPLNNVCNNNAKFEISNSLLSEYAVLGFEYGYSLSSPDTFVAWEAQFGDFSNGAQIVFDQYISSAQEKWGISNDIVILLPHGYEGQGPEHSSARIERFLSLCSSDNMQIINCSTPANYFHVLRRQKKKRACKPLIIFTPKSLLRHPLCVSNIYEFSHGKFQEVIDDVIDNPLQINKIVFCSGKIYYELIKEKENKNITDVAIVRIEQLYPFPKKQINDIINKYSKAEKWIWTQEEPANMGAWTFFSRHFAEIPLMLVARPDSSSPATGSIELHKKRQNKLMEKTFGNCNCERRDESCRMYCSEQEWKFIKRNI